MKQKQGILLLLLLLTSGRSFGQQDTRALKAWQEQKYSMFIHFGIYSVLGGVWEGKPVTKGLSEQIQAHAGIYSDTYAETAKQFDPEKWNADSVVMLAKRAGMRSIVITSKHHDGFCMFKTNTTDFNVVDATPYKRDILKELSEACKKGGLRFALYFSLIDWHYPQASPISSSNSDYITPEHFQYNKQQVTELLTNYGPVSELWFDMGSQSASESKELRELVHQLQPGCMIGSRIGNDMGDFTVMGDNQEPDYVIGVPWQSPASFFDETWSYRSWQERGSEEEKMKEKLTSLIRVVSRGGNFLLNIGPKGDGSIVPFEKDVLLQIGDWLKKNGEAIYGVRPDPFHISFKWGSLTSRKDHLYLHLLSAPENNTVFLPGLTGKIEGIKVLSTGEKVRFSQSAKGVEVVVPPGLDIEKMFKVIDITFSNGFQVPPANILPLPGEGTAVLASANGFKHFSNSGIDYDTRYQSTVKESWTLQPTQNGTYQPRIYFSAQEKGKTIDVEVAGQVSAVTFDEGTVVPLHPTSEISWGQLYQIGPYYSGVGSFHGDVRNIDINKPWPNSNDQRWKKSAYQNNQVYELSVEKQRAVYLLQEIESDKDQAYLVKITSGDAVTIALNGTMILEHNNPFKVKQLQDQVLLQLKKGKNQLLVKYYNGYQKSTVLGIDTTVKQEIFYKDLKPVSMDAGKYYPFSWQLHEPLSPHTTLGLSNVSIELKKK
ncbi:alpha-L-fucosidase precursor, putative [Pedobacter sp. BAL39]|uniref:alpha-L-fucosidase n=1 Tax=Pedobacter sp. BAL39 TaxID=391596 RepID=UPI00015599EB|nr:alpha-L-fucosidase [Pedobacter sp. BAL39]EDM37218.1 alpha-L-fucosidase precursor, putative [Pedobacter sp. BAL39]